MVHFLTSLLAGMVMVAGCKPEDRSEAFRRMEGDIFGTRYRIEYRSGADVASVRAAVIGELERIDQMASTWKSDSELMRYNRANDQAAFPLSAGLSFLLERSEEIKVMTDGAFDVRYQSAGIDLSAIAKGYAVDQVSELLKDRFGVESSLVDIGGEIKVRGPGPKGDAWKIGLYLPNRPNTVRVDFPVIELRDSSVATSGTYFRGPHLIDPLSDKAVDHDLISVSVIHPSNTMADALATALYVMGPEEGLEWAKEHNLHVLFLFKNGAVKEHHPEPSGS